MPRAALRLMLALSLVVACSDESTDPGGILRPLDAASDWIGEYRGNGAGVIDGEATVVTDAVLTIELDAVEIRLPGCPLCVTVRLDDDFLLANVAVESLTELDLAYREGVVLRTLRLERALLGLEALNQVEARLTIGNADAPSPIVDLTYLLERP